MNEAAIRRQIEVLEHIQASEELRKRFNLSTFVTHPGEDGTFSLSSAVMQANNACGTVGCAFGWFAIAGQWPGLRLTNEADSDKLRQRGQVAYEAAPGKFVGAAAAIMFVFEFEYEETADRIFYPNGYGYGPHVTPGMVIEKLRDLLAVGEARFLQHEYGGSVYTHGWAPNGHVIRACALREAVAAT